MHLAIGNVGHALVILTFLTAALAAVSYFQASRHPEDTSWLRLSRVLFAVHMAAILGVVISLFIIIKNHYFEYHYAWAHSSRGLAGEYLISCFWEGQEGSFLLWIFWNGILGLVMMAFARRWEAPAMATFALVQAFLASMILGVMLGDVKLGSSPFTLLRDAITAPIFLTNPNFIPEDGTGLNPILQNYWMVIHPPTLFLGFASTLVPFSLLVAGLAKREYRAWVKPALPWSLFSAAVLGLGIAMGAYWAYETLSFGGYWSWDPVENAVYVPWLVLVAAVHVMIIYRRSTIGLKTSMILVALCFLLVLYATFMIRSGILAESSVHSFTDLGLSGQLLIYLLAFLAGAVVLMAVRWRHIPTTEKELNLYSREFWIFMGTTVLLLSGLHVLFNTSFPVFNEIVEAFGGISNLAVNEDPMAFYGKFHLWFSVFIALLSGTGQFFWWQKMEPKRLWQALSAPVVVTLLVMSILLFAGVVDNWQYIVLAMASIYTVVANGFILARLVRRQPKLSGGSITHMGLGLVLLGVLFSSGYSEVVSLNQSGMVYSTEFSDEMNQENVLLWYGEGRQMGDYRLTYLGRKMAVEGFPSYVNGNQLRQLPQSWLAVAADTLAHRGTDYFVPGDTVKIYPEDHYYQVEYITAKQDTFYLYPKVQINPQMGMIAAPDIRQGLQADLYTHLSSVPDPEAPVEWRVADTVTATIGQQLFLNDYAATLEGLTLVPSEEIPNLQPGDLAVKAQIRIFTERSSHLVEPLLLMVQQPDGQRKFYTEPAEDLRLGVRLGIQDIQLTQDQLVLSVERAQRDYVILKALRKPLINVLWIGVVVMLIGFTIAIVRRWGESRKELTA